MGEPRSRRDAIVAQLAGELDEIVQRVEQLGPRLDEANQRIEGGTAALNAAIEQYRNNVGTLTAQVLKSIGEFAVRRTNEAAARSVEEQQAVLQESARRAFEVELAPRLQVLADALARTANRLERPRRFDWLSHAITAVLSAGIVAAALFYVVRP